MGLSDVERKTNSFWQHQKAEFPELADSGRHESRTAKYDSSFSRY